MKRLDDTVAVVTGASRGAGRGIVLSLGKEGATVYVAGRSAEGESTREDPPGTTIDETAEMVTEHGGIGTQPLFCQTLPKGGLNT